MLSSDDIEMVNLGANLLKKLPRKRWAKIMKECQENNTWYFIINKNQITIYPIKLPSYPAGVSGTFNFTGWAPGVSTPTYIIGGRNNTAIGYNGLGNTSYGTSNGTYGSITVTKNGQIISKSGFNWTFEYKDRNVDLDERTKDENKELAKQGWTIKTNKYGKANSKNRRSKPVRPSARRNAYAGR